MVLCGWVSLQKTKTENCIYGYQSPFFKLPPAGITPRIWRRSLKHAITLALLLHPRDRRPTTWPQTARCKRTKHKGLLVSTAGPPHTTSQPPVLLPNRKHNLCAFYDSGSEILAPNLHNKNECQMQNQMISDKSASSTAMCPIVLQLRFFP